ncbi:MAG: AmmeMemoRadiSam system protein B [Anaerolineaceae bacterium]
MDANFSVRPSPIAGIWYTSDPEQLKNQIDHFIADAKISDLNGQVVGIIAPHAGYRYSGRTAGYAFRTILGASYDLVIVVSPLHGYSAAKILTSTHLAYETPLGIVEIDKEAQMSLSAILEEDFNIRLVYIANDNEHSLEIEIPFLQRALQGKFKLLPIMMRSLALEDALCLGKAIAQQMNVGKVLLVASTDLSHFYPVETANQLDQEMLRQVESFSIEGVFSADQTGKGFACGLGALASVMEAAKLSGANQIRVLHHSTSADVTGDRSSVVGYGSAVILNNPALG